MGKTRKDKGTLQTLLNRLNNERLPRALQLKSRVNAGERLSATDIEFLQRVFEDAGNLITIAARTPEYRSLFEKMISLYAEITDKALANEQRAGAAAAAGAEYARLQEARERNAPWKKWGPYLSERQWGTVREDYSDSGDAWNYFTHDQARSRVYRWGEDGLGGISDDKQALCFAVALWNGQDPILKERLFGLTNSEGNHGEDVKECYFYLDSTPTHSYLKYLYKYPHSAYPYDELVKVNRARRRNEPEYELLDTGVFDGNRYFDVFVEYAKASSEDILIEITVCNRGAETAVLHLLPTLWFRNTWLDGSERPVLRHINDQKKLSSVAIEHCQLGRFFLHAEGAPEWLFTENETNNQRLFGTPNSTRYVKDAFHEYLIHGRQEAVNPDKTGTKAAAHYVLSIPGNQTAVVRLRLTHVPASQFIKSTPKSDGPLAKEFAAVFAARRREADEFYSTVIPAALNADTANIMRQALAGMLWSKQFYYYDVERWLQERGVTTENRGRLIIRNERWHHMYNADIISMPDKWEYPWYAAWDLAFHTLALTLVDSDFGKEQLDLMMRSTYLHPNGQLPAYEWNFGDVNPPVHAWATLFTYRLEEAHRGQGDIKWLERCFHKLLLNFTWWVNRKDRSGNNVFEGGFLGLDNIGVFDRSAPLPTGGYLEQADGTAWMTLFSQNMLEIAVELALQKPTYVDMCKKFFEHFLWIASSMMQVGGEIGMWDEADGFCYDVLRLPNGGAQQLKVRSLVGLLPLCAATVFDGRLVNEYPDVLHELERFLKARPQLTSQIHDPAKRGHSGRLMASIFNEARLRRVLARMLDENEFLSPFGIRSLSRAHADHPFVYRLGSHEYRVDYLPGESDSGMFGGNSNWRGPIWAPVNLLIVRALLQYYCYYGDSFTIECPTGSGLYMNLYQIAEEISRRLVSVFLKDSNDRRPVNGAAREVQRSPHWRDLLNFYEYFHADTGAGLGASHQTGWTGIVARLAHFFATTSAGQVLTMGKAAAVTELYSPPRR